jgi:hypothetical protein
MSILNGGFVRFSLCSLLKHAYVLGILFDTIMERASSIEQASRSYATKKQQEQLQQQKLRGEKAHLPKHV